MVAWMGVNARCRAAGDDRNDRQCNDAIAFYANLLVNTCLKW
ncbi:MAG: hypothetical protein N6V49_03135 [Serratia symbiotica]|nr:hypothetical protein [Serratia symbiotica]